MGVQVPPSAPNIDISNQSQSVSMQFTEIPCEGLERSFKVTVPATDIEGQIESELAKLAKTTKLPGFRVGKVPIALVTKKYSQSIRMDVTERSIRNSISTIIQQYKLDVAGSPSIDDVKNDEHKDLVFTLNLEVIPQVHLPKFREIQLTRPQIEMTDKEMDEQLHKIAEVYKEFTPTTKATKAKNGDKIIIDFEGFVKDEPFDGGKAEKFELILGSKSFIDTFEDQLVGTKSGDEALVKVTFPKQYHAENLAGKKAEFKVKVHEILTAEVPKIDDELARKCKYTDVQELRTKTIEAVKTVYDDTIYGVLKRQLFDHLDSMLKFDIPKRMYQKEYDALEAQIASMDNADDKEISDKDLKKYFERVARRRIRIGLMLSEYVKQHSIKLEQDDLKKAVLKEARNFPGQEMKIFEYYQSNPNAVEKLSGRVLEDKAVETILLKEVIMQDKAYSLASIQKFIEDENAKEVI